MQLYFLYIIHFNLNNYPELLTQGYIIELEIQY